MDIYHQVEGKLKLSSYSSKSLLTIMMLGLLIFFDIHHILASANLTTIIVVLKRKNL